MSRIELPLQMSGRKPVISAGLIVSFVALIAAGILLGMWRQPAANAMVLPLTIAVCVATCLALIPLTKIISRRHVFVENGELVIVTGMGTKKIALAHLRARGLDVVDLRRRGEFVPRIRVWAASMPGLSAGWFTLRNGEKAFCLITEQDRVSYLRSATDNVSLLLSLENPEQLIALLQS